jgi:hypothetical protein
LKRENRKAGFIQDENPASGFEGKIVVGRNFD